MQLKVHLEILKQKDIFMVDRSNYVQGRKEYYSMGGNDIIPNRRYDEFYTKWKSVKNGV